LPNLASAHEQGLADFEAPTWFAVFLPRGASEPIIRKLNQAAFATADTPSVQERPNVIEIATAIIALGREPGGGLVVTADAFVVAHRADHIGGGPKQRAGGRYRI
jgi:Tripartite tricarboxylate transporter family receptor